VVSSDEEAKEAMSKAEVEEVSSNKEEEEEEEDEEMVADEDASSDEEASATETDLAAPEKKKKKKKFLSDREEEPASELEGSSDEEASEKHGSARTLWRRTRKTRTSLRTASRSRSPSQRGCPARFLHRTGRTPEIRRTTGTSTRTASKIMMDRPRPGEATNTRGFDHYGLGRA
jgi:hypothetical protein